MAELDLRPIRERLAKATPGEWLRLQPLQAVATRPMREDEDEDEDETIESIGLMVGTKEAVCMVLAEDPLRKEPDTDKMWSDADLIAHAPTDLAALCNEIESLRTRLAATQAECDRLRSRVARMAQALESIRTGRHRDSDTPCPADDQAWWIADEALMVLRRAKETSDGQ